MNELYPSLDKNATLPRNIHRPRSAILEKIVSFDVLAHLQHTVRSEREITAILEVPNSTMRSWKIQQRSYEEMALYEFFSTPHGAHFLERLVTGAIFTIEYGPRGIRGTQQYLRLIGVDQYVSTSTGALHAYSKRIEQQLIAFGATEQKRLAKRMKERKITIVLDEMFRSKNPCLVAIEAVSNFILLEKFTKDRTAETWKNEVNASLDGLPVKVGQVVSDLCGAITSYAKEVGAQHSPDLFHSLYELSKATAAPLSSQENAFEKAVAKAESGLKKAIKKHGEASKQAEEAASEHNLRVYGLEERKKRRERVKECKKVLGTIYHPVDIQNGQIQTEDAVKEKINEQLKTIKQAAREAGLSRSCMDRIAKAGRAFDAMMNFLKAFFIMFGLHIDALNLPKDQKRFFLNVVFPLVYLKMILKRQGKKEKERLSKLIANLEIKIREGPWPNELKESWMQMAKELAELFQRSSSCVEGRNGMLSLLHHCSHRLSESRLKALSVVHNYHIIRPDSTTAAERFFGEKHGNLFESLVANVRLPGRPRYRQGCAKMEAAA